MTANAMKIYFVFLILLLTAISSCGGGGGGRGGGLVWHVGWHSYAGLPGGQVDLAVNTGNPPYTYQIIDDPLATGATVDENGIVTIPNYGTDIGYVTVLVIDSKEQYQELHITLLGGPNPWYQGSQVNSSDVNNDQQVSRWEDISGQGTHTDTKANCEGDNDCPLLTTTTGLNAMPVLYFDGSDDFLSFINGITYSDITIALVAKIEDPGTADSTHWYENSGLIDSYSAGQFGISVRQNGYFYSGVSASSEQTLTSTEDKHDAVGHVIIMTREKATGTVELWIDSIQQAVNTTGGTDDLAAGNVRIGSLLGGSQFFNGYIGEVLFYNKYLGGASNDQRQELERYLKGRYRVGDYPVVSSAVINSGAGFTNSPTVSIALTTADTDPYQVCIREDDDFYQCDWLSWTTPISFELSTGDTLKTLHFWMKNGSQGITPANKDIEASITLDQTSPSGVPQITTPAAASGYSTVPALNFVWNANSCADTGSGLSGSYYVKVGTSSGGTDKFVGNVSGTSKAITCNSGETCHIDVYCMDNIGNISSASDYSNITVDTSTPTAASNILDDSPDLDYKNTTSATWYWSAGSDGESSIASYELFTYTSLANCSSHASGTSRYTGTALDSGAIAGLSNGTAYWAAVLATNNAGLTAWSSCSDGIAIDTTAPVAGSVTTPAATAYQNTTAYTWAWSAGSDSYTGLHGTTPYHLYTYTDNTCAAGEADRGTTTSTSMNISGLSNSTSYWAKVIYMDKAGNTTTSACSANKVMIDTTVPTKPTVNDAATYSSSNSVTWSWSAGTDSYSGVQTYNVKACTDSACTAGCIAGTNTTGTSQTVSGLTNGVAYYGCVQTVDNANNVSGYDASTNTTLIDTTAPSAGAITAPVATVYQNTTSYTWAWSAGSDGISGLHSTTPYHLYTYTNSACSAGEADRGTTTSTSMNISGLSNSTSYWARVTYMDKIGNTANSACAAYAVVVDTTNPSVSITGTARASATTRTATLSYSDSYSGVASYQCSINGSTWVACTSSTTYTVTVTVGTTQSYYLKVTDNAGNSATTNTSDYILRNARSSAECTAAGGAAETTTSYSCRVNAASCPGGWSQYSTYATYTAATCGTAGSCSTSCTTSSSAWSTSAQPTCTYDAGNITGWHWTSYGWWGTDPVDPITAPHLESGNTSSSATSCDKALTESGCTNPSASCPGDRCCRQTCTVNCNSVPGTTCYATRSQIGCQ